MGKLFCIIQMGPNAMTCILINGRQRRCHTHGGEGRGSGQRRDGAETGVMQPQAEEYQQAPKDVRGRKQIPLESLEGAQSY